MIGEALMDLTKAVVTEVIGGAVVLTKAAAAAEDFKTSVLYIPIC